MSTDSVSPLRQRMIEDMNARKLCAGTQRGHLRGCKRFAAFLKRSPETATAEDIRRFQLHLAEAGLSICTRNQIMTGLSSLQRCVHHATATRIFRHTPARRSEKRVSPELQRHRHHSPRLAADLSRGPHSAKSP
jgi:integrase/recombinase XerD